MVTFQTILDLIAVLISALLIPGLVVGTVRKVKARLQNRVGAPIWQPWLDLIKLLRKGETLSTTASFVFRLSTVLTASIMVYLALVVPWVYPRPTLIPCDFIMVLYCFGLVRLFTLLAAMDTGSAFGAFAASRETTLSFLVEPAAILSLAAICMTSGSTDLNVAFASSEAHFALWSLSGTALLLASIVELSRMPIDDPTTHLELTMVHEALILEASGKNLALLEFGNNLRMSILFGLSAQCYLQAVTSPNELGPTLYAACSMAMLFLVASLVGVFESLIVKLNWRKAPEFISYVVAASLMACMVAMGAGIR